MSEYLILRGKKHKGTKSVGCAKDMGDAFQKEIRR